MIIEDTISQTKFVDYSVKFDDSTLHIGVDNLGELKELIKNIDDKQKELQEAVRNLSRFKQKSTSYKLS